MSQGEASSSSCCAKERAQDRFPTNLIIPHPSGHDTAAETHHLCLLLYKVCVPIPLPKIISETPQGNNWRTRHLQSNRPLWQQDSLERVSSPSPGHSQAAFRGGRGAIPKNCQLHLEGECSTGVCRKEEGEPKCCT